MGRFNYIIYKEKRLDKFSRTEQEDLIFDLINAFALVNNPLDSALLLQDLLTEDEIKDLAKRLRIAKLLLTGETHENIVGQLHCSFATVTKVRIWLDSSGVGFKKVLKKLPQRKRAYISKKTPGVGYGLPEIISYYAASTLKNNEDKRLNRFLENIKQKASQDQDLKEEIASGFQKQRK